MAMPNDSNSPNPPVPVGLEKTDDRRLVIRWSDDVEQSLPFRTLRDNCACANCMNERLESAGETSAGEKKLSNNLPILSMAETLPLDIVTMHPVGNYAYNIHFSDGHSAGIFTFEMLRSLS